MRYVITFILGFYKVIIFKSILKKVFENTRIYKIYKPLCAPPPPQVNSWLHHWCTVCAVPTSILLYRKPLELVVDEAVNTTIIYDICLSVECVVS